MTAFETFLGTDVLVEYNGRGGECCATLKAIEGEWLVLEYADRGKALVRASSVTGIRQVLTKAEARRSLEADGLLTPRLLERME